MMPRMFCRWRRAHRGTLSAAGDSRSTSTLLIWIWVRAMLRSQKPPATSFHLLSGGLSKQFSLRATARGRAAGQIIRTELLGWENDLAELVEPPRSGESPPEDGERDQGRRAP